MPEANLPQGERLSPNPGDSDAAPLIVVRFTRARQPADSAIWTTLALCAGVLTVTYACTMLAYRRKIA